MATAIFRAVSASIYGDDAHYASITVQFLTDHQNHFKQFTDGEDVQGQIQTMSKNGCWATTCELYVDATVLQRELYVFTPHSGNTEYKWILIQPVLPHQEMLI
ncbi:hypothetical protein BgiMline_034413, partial [Biomphalaria glabrata]